MAEGWGVVLFALLTAGGGWLAARLLIRRGTAEYQKEEEALRRISATPLDEVAAIAQSLLADPSLFRCVETEGDGGSFAWSAPGLQQVLRRYVTIESERHPGTFVARASIGPSTQKAGFVRIGSVGAGTDVEGELAVRSGDETIYELYSNEPLDPAFGTYRSIYHWVVAMAETRG